MNDQEFLDAMMSYERLDQARRLKKEQEKERKKVLLQRLTKKENKEGERKRPYAKISGNTKQSSPKSRKFCQYCKDNDGKWWTHNTKDCYFKKPRKETNAIKAVHKEIDDLKSVIKASRGGGQQ